MPAPAQRTSTRTPMKTRTKLLILAPLCSALLTPTVRSHADEGLFSKVAMESVFDDSKETNDDESTTRLSEAERKRAARIAALFQADTPPQTPPKSKPPAGNVGSSINEASATAEPSGGSTISSNADAAAQNVRGTKDKPTKSSFSLAGQWAATTAAGEVFAIAFTPEQRFFLVHMKSGKTSISKGNFTVTDDRLSLATEKAQPLKAEIQWKSVGQMVMKLGTSKLNFQRKK
ncbi:secreted protein [Rhodopirellula sallentina SM41]|uniref:Secreted protein n=2 Tax=Rhodopirellula TaxID=265488 RepID=M5TZ86_9BACT|nr:secreted protein [Rhodopirellula sallentina SM41]